MRILEKAEGAFGACVVYEHNGQTFRACGSSLLEIQQRLSQGLNGDPVQPVAEAPTEEPEAEPEEAEESGITTDESQPQEEVSGQSKKKDLNPEGNEDDSERKSAVDL